MRTSPRVIGAAAGVVALLVSGCTSSTADPGWGATESVSPVATSSPTVSDEPTPTVSASPHDPFAVPDPVTEEYVDRVVNAIYEEWGAITREILEQPADPSGITDVETRERIAALFSDESLVRRYEEADGVVRGDRQNLLPPEDFGSVAWRSRRIFVANLECLVVAGDFDTTRTAVESTSVLTTLSLEPVARDATRELNPTGWRIRDAVANTGEGGEVFNDDVMLTATLEDFGDLLSTTCPGDSDR